MFVESMCLFQGQMQKADDKQTRVQSILDDFALGRGEAVGKGLKAKSQRQAGPKTLGGLSEQKQAV